MVIIVVASLAACGGALFSVLDRPVTGHRRLNAALSPVLLAVSATLLLAAVLGGLARWVLS